MDKIKANLIFEILGRPKEHIKTALSSMMDKFGTENGIKINEKKIHEPTEVEKSKDLFTTFAEVSVEFDKLENLLGVLFAYMPSHIEILSPAELNFTNLQINDLSNTLLMRLHNYDAITKKFIFERDFLLKKLKEVAPNMFRENQEVKQEENKENQEIKKEPKKAKKSKK